MIDAVGGLLGIVLFCIVVAIMTAIGFIAGVLTTSLLIAMAVGIALTLAYAVIGWAFTPRPRRDHYEIPFGDYPKVTRGRM